MKDQERKIGFQSLNKRNNEVKARSGEIIIADQSGSTILTQLKSALDHCLKQEPSAENDANIDFLRELIHKANSGESSLFSGNDNCRKIIPVSFAKKA